MLPSIFDNVCWNLSMAVCKRAFSKPISPCKSKACLSVVSAARKQPITVLACCKFIEPSLSNSIKVTISPAQSADWGTLNFRNASSTELIFSLLLFRCSRNSVELLPPLKNTSKSHTSE